MAGATTASPACARTTGQTISRPMSSIPKAIGSKPITGESNPMATIRSELKTPSVGERRMVGDPRHRRAPYAARPRLCRRHEARAGRACRDLRQRRCPARTNRHDSTTRRGAWSGPPRAAAPDHYNASLQVFSLPDGGHVRRLDRRLPARRHPRLPLAGDRCGNGGDATRPGPARGMNAVSHWRACGDLASVFPAGSHAATGRPKPVAACPHSSGNRTRS